MIGFHNNVLLFIPIVFLCGWWHIWVSMCVFKLHMLMDIVSFFVLLMLEWLLDFWWAINWN
jgi:hypothetical protein